MGSVALNANTTGQNNTAIGQSALNLNVTGSDNTAIGFSALSVSTVSQLTAVGSGALQNNTTGIDNVAIGYQALNGITTGLNNIALGQGAGSAFISSESNNIDIGNVGVISESNTIRIGSPQTATFIVGITGASVAVGALPVLVDATGKLGTVPSSRKYKDNIADMADESSPILKLRPVTFTYKSDAAKTKQFGLIAEEEVYDVLPALVVRGADGQIETVKYHELATLLLNELIKQQAVIEKQQVAMEKQRTTIEKQNATIEALKCEDAVWKHDQFAMNIRLGKLEEAT